jgi:hypothetical protein
MVLTWEDGGLVEPRRQVGAELGPGEGPVEVVLIIGGGLKPGPGDGPSNGGKAAAV